MAKIRIVGDSSGYVEIAAPSAAGNNTLELPSGNTRLVGSDSAGNVSISGIVTAATFSGNVNSTGISTFTSGVVVSAGSTSAPSISPTEDSNTGIFFPSADTIAFAEGGAEAARFDSSGRLGIGTVSPFEGLHVVRSSNGNQFAVDNTGQQYSSINLKHNGTRKGVLEWNNTAAALELAVDGSGSPTGSLTFSTGNATRVTIDSSGRITRPYQPAFNASGVSGNVSYSSGGIFQFSTADLNVGNHFNTSTYKFTAPVAGVYLFGVSIYVNGNISACFAVNGTQTYGGSDVQPLVYGDATRSYSAQLLVSLSANDIVDFRSRDVTGSATIYMGHSNFWGYLM